MRAWLAGLAVALVLAPVCVWVAFSAHEPRCEDAEAFWLGDLPTGEPVEGVVLGSSRMGMDLDVHALAAETGGAWQRVARHAVEQASIPATYPRLLASTDARPGLRWLVLEASPLMFDAKGCGRPELEGVTMRAHWAPAAREMLGDDAELAPAVAMGWLPHRWLMTSGRRHDVVEHLKRPAHAARLVADLPHALEGFSPPGRWAGEVPPDLTMERVWRRRQFLLGAPVDTFVPAVNEACVATLARVVDAARAERTLLVIPPLREAMRDTLPADYRAAVRAAMERVAASRPSVRVLDATDHFAGEEDARFSDFDHLGEAGAAAFTRDVAAALR
ncbi:MAG: SGNH/GDSL hydrolase family protein [Myxococcota bacterium]